jgi:hypothetical protein
LSGEFYEILFHPGGALFCHFALAAKIVDTTWIDENFSLVSYGTQLTEFHQLIYDFSSNPKVLDSLRDTYKIRQFITERYFLH